MKSIIFPMRRTLAAAVKTLLLLASFSAALTVNQSLSASESAEFALSSIEGCYIEALSGVVLPDPTNPTLQLPVASLIRFCADGEGGARVSGTQNIAGSCIVEQTGEAAYRVNKNGTGNLKFPTFSL